MTVAEDGAPPFERWGDDDLTTRCPTFLGTDKVEQIRARSDVHLKCDSMDSDRPGTYLRVVGQAEISTDAVDRRLAWNDLLEKWFSGQDDPNSVVVRIVPPRIGALPIGGGPDAQVREA